MKRMLDPNITRRRAERRAAAFGWGNLMLGMALAALVTALLMEPNLAGMKLFWFVWGIGLVASAVLVLAGIGSADLPAGPAPVPSVARRTWSPEEMPVPKLGEILVGEHRVITEEQLQRVLAERRRSGRPIGETALGMGLISRAQLDAALERQLFYREQYGVQSWRG